MHDPLTSATLIPRASEYTRLPTTRLRPCDRLVLREPLVRVQRVVVHRDHAEQVVVVLRDGLARPVPVHVADLEVLVVAAEGAVEWSREVTSCPPVRASASEPDGDRCGGAAPEQAGSRPARYGSYRRRTSRWSGVVTSAPPSQRAEAPWRRDARRDGALHPLLMGVAPRDRRGQHPRHRPEPGLAGARRARRRVVVQRRVCTRGCGARGACPRPCRTSTKCWRSGSALGRAGHVGAGAAGAGRQRRPRHRLVRPAHGRAVRPVRGRVARRGRRGRRTCRTRSSGVATFAIAASSLLFTVGAAVRRRAPARPPVRRDGRRARRDRLGGPPRRFGVHLREPPGRGDPRVPGGGVAAAGVLGGRTSGPRRSRHPRAAGGGPRARVPDDRGERLGGAPARPRVGGACASCGA